MNRAIIIALLLAVGCTQQARVDDIEVRLNALETHQEEQGDDIEELVGIIWKQGGRIVELEDSGSSSQPLWERLYDHDTEISYQASRQESLSKRITGIEEDLAELKRCVYLGLCE